MLSRSAGAVVGVVLLSHSGCSSCPPQGVHTSVPIGIACECPRASNGKVKERERSEPSQRKLCADLERFDEGWDAMRRMRGDAFVLAYSASFPGVEEVVRRTKSIDGVHAAESFEVFEARILSDAGFFQLPVQGRGPVSLGRTAPFVEQGSLGGLEESGSGLAVALGRGLALRLEVGVGDEIGVSPIAPDPTSEGALTIVRVRVAAILDAPGVEVSGLIENDVVMGERAADELWKRAFGEGLGATGVVVFANEGADETTLAARVDGALNDPTYRVIRQGELNRGALDGVRLMRRWCGKSE